MNFIRKAIDWLLAPRKDTAQEAPKAPREEEFVATNLPGQPGTIADFARDGKERERKEHVATLPEQPDLTDDPDTDVPEPHLGKVQHVDLTTPVKRGQQAPAHLQDLSPSDWDLLSPEEKRLFEQITPHAPEKIVRYHAPTEQSTADWVTEQLQKAGYSEAYRLRFMATRRMAIGMSMNHLGDLKARAERKDPSLSVHDLIALRSRGIA